MSIYAEIRGELKDAMLKKEVVRLGVIRGLITAFTNELVAKGRKPQEELSDDDAIAVIRRAVKQRKDSIEQFTKGGRKDLVDEELKELKVLEKYLPKLMSKADIKNIVVKKQKDMGITDESKMGILMGAVMKELKGKADGQDVKEVVESLFQDNTYSLLSKL